MMMCGLSIAAPHEPCAARPQRCPICAVVVLASVSKIRAVLHSDCCGCGVQCPYEWFHYACVGLTEPPNGKWECSTCASAQNKKAKRR